MFFHFRVLAYSIFFYLVVELATTDFVGSFFAEHFWAGMFLVLVVLFIFFRIAKIISQRISMTPITVIFVASTLGLLYFIQSDVQRNVLIAICAFVFYFFHIALYRLRVYHKDKTALGIVGAASVGTVFLCYATAIGIYLNFDIPLWAGMVFLMLVTALVSSQYFWIIKPEKKMVINYSLMLGFVMAEVAWVINFWPFGYLTTGVIALIFYYVFWDMVRSHFLGRLSKRRVIGNLAFSFIAVAIVLTSSHWFPVV
jgi:hypothetical protein